MVERRSPKPEVGGSIPSAPARKIDYEKPFKIYSGSKTRGIPNNLANKKRDNDRCANGICFGVNSCNIFFTSRSNFKIFTKFYFNH